MKKRLLGNTGIQITEVGYGAAALFGKNEPGRQGITGEQAIKLIYSYISQSGFLLILVSIMAMQRNGLVVAFLK